jgi:hypothetical protein
MVEEAKVTDPHLLHVITSDRISDAVPEALPIRLGLESFQRILVGLALEEPELRA